VTIFKGAPLWLAYLQGLGVMLGGLVATGVIVYLAIIGIASIASAIVHNQQAKEKARIAAGIEKKKCMTSVLWNNLKDKVCLRIEYID
jgi:hypothetical protein